MRRLKSITCGFAILLAGCSGGGGSGGGSGGTPTPTPTPTPAPTPTPTPSVTLTYLHSIKDIVPDGAAAIGLIKASDGNFYGVSGSGPNTCRPSLPIPCGSVVKVTPDGTQSVLYAFGSVADDGYQPNGLIQGKDGALYGITDNGGKAGGGGTLFKLTLSGVYTSLHSFGVDNADGASPVSLIQASDGNFYGTTASGGANHCDQIPQAGSNCGAVFKATPDGVVTTLYSFGAAPSDGIEPLGALTEGSDGNLYGTTSIGGANTCGSAANSCGTVFRISKSGSVTILHSFGGSLSDGIAPEGTLIKGPDGAFYGTTLSGGGGRCGNLFGCGTVFRITTAGAISTLHAFSLVSQDDGAYPNTLILGRDGNFYGTTVSGGAYECDSCGSVFRLTPAGALTTLYSFGPLQTNPSGPLTLTEASDGTLYGQLEYDVLLSGNAVTFFKLVQK